MESRRLSPVPAGIASKPSDPDEIVAEVERKRAKAAAERERLSGLLFDLQRVEEQLAIEAEAARRFALQETARKRAQSFAAAAAQERMAAEAANTLTAEAAAAKTAADQAASAHAQALAERNAAVDIVTELEEKLTIARTALAEWQKREGDTRTTSAAAAAKNARLSTQATTAIDALTAHRVERQRAEELLAEIRSQLLEHGISPEAPAAQPVALVTTEQLDEISTGIDIQSAAERRAAERREADEARRNGRSR